jgi:phosphatidylserine/phosphatidylglycerophosphate/cardiolipin synthase-like enzyme
LAFFNVRLNEVRDLLVAKDQAGLDVHVVLDSKQQDLPYNTMAAELRQAGVTVTEVDNTSAADATMHNKFTVIDGRRVLTGSANYSTTALNISDEDLVTFDDAALAGRFELEFSELVAGTDVASVPYPSGARLEAWMGPEDGLYDHVVAALDGAQTSALCAMFTMNTAVLVQALIDAHDRGVTVVVVLDADQATDAGADADETLIAAGVPVILADNTGSAYAEMHSKFLVVDHQLVLMGSYNWTNLGSYFNDESILRIDDAHLASRVEGKFAQLLNDYAAVSASSLGLADGVQQVTFRVTNVTLEAGIELLIESVGPGPFETPAPLANGQVTTNVATGTRVEYRYSVRDDTGTLSQEGGARSFTVPYAAGPFEVVDAYKL